MTPDKHIVLIGAYGYTGKLIAKELQQAQIPFTAAGKNPQKLGEAFPNRSTLQVDLSDKKDRDDLISNFDVYLNCAGPFTEESAEFVNEIAATKNKVYLDISGEVDFVRASLASNNELAAANNSTLIHGCAFESVLADFGTKVLARKMDSIKAAYTYYQFEHSKPSPGTRITMKLNKFRDSKACFDGEWRAINSIGDRKKVDFGKAGNWVATPYPLPEIAFFHHELKASSSLSYLLLSEQEALFVGQAKEVTGDLHKELERLKARKKSGPNVQERQQQKWKIIVELISSSNHTKQVLLEGKDMYGITAKCMSMTLAILLKTKKLPTGVISPANLLMSKEDELLSLLAISCTFK